MKSILVIEDKQEVRENIVEMLELAQYATLQAADGKRGVELARSANPDLILCDIMMPELDGYSVLHILSQDPITASISFIFLTAKVEPAHFRNGMNLGADDYLTKPFDDIALLSAVALRLKKSEQTRRQTNLDGLTNRLSAISNSDEIRQRLGDEYPTSHYKKKQLLFEEGHFPTSLYFIRRGQLRRFKTDALGNEFITALSGEGDFVGYAALLPETAYAESAELLSDAEVCTVAKADFFTLIDQNPDVANHFMRLLAGEVANRDERLLKLAYQSVRKRVAEALLMVQHKFYPVGGPTAVDGGVSPNEMSGSNQSPPMSLSRENWAQVVGASTETVIRTLSDLRAEGLIDLTGSKITILDFERLTRLKH